MHSGFWPLNQSEVRDRLLVKKRFVWKTVQPYTWVGSVWLLSVQQIVLALSFHKPCNRHRSLLIVRSEITHILFNSLLLLLQALELRARCGCPALSEPDPRVAFSKIAGMLLEDAEKEKNRAKEWKERVRAEGKQQSVQPQLGAALALSAQQQTLLSKEDLTETWVKSFKQKEESFYMICHVEYDSCYCSVRSVTFVPALTIWQYCSVINITRIYRCSQPRQPRGIFLRVRFYLWKNMKSVMYNLWAISFHINGNIFWTRLRS